MKKMLFLIALASGLMILSSCGIRGSLYMPEDLDEERCGQYPEDECGTGEEAPDERFIGIPEDPDGDVYFNPLFAL